MQKPIIIEDDLDLTEEDLDELGDPNSSKPYYEVWALGINKFDSPTNFEVLLGVYSEPEDAINFAWTVDINLVKSKTAKTFPSNLKLLNIEVETVIYDDDNSAENVGTIFRTELLV